METPDSPLSLASVGPPPGSNRVEYLEQKLTEYKRYTTMARDALKVAQQQSKLSAEAKTRAENAMKEAAKDREEECTKLVENLADLYWNLLRSEP
jgi:hypothetical protein